MNQSDTAKFPIPKAGAYSFKSIPLDDPRVWAMISRGQTIGVFQLETQLGQDWAKKARPKSIEDLAALIAILRPGVLETGMAELYTQRKNGLEEVEYKHEQLRPILEDTFGCLLYQETSIRIAMELAGFDEVTADMLRIALGKKKPELVAELKDRFIDQAASLGKLNKEEAEEIFGWIEKGQRYLFNLCLARDSIVRTRDRGDIRIDDVKIGDWVEAPPSNDLYSDLRNWVEVTNIYHNGTKEMYRTTFVGGHDIVCTLDHKFKCSDGKTRPLKDILDDQSMKVVLRNAEPAKHISCDYVGIRDSIDIEVDSEDHIFYANGIATSNSHSVSYALHAYYCAYAKCHYPLEFYTSWLTYSDWKQKPKEEIYNLVQDARMFGLTILPPDIRCGNPDFTILSRDKKQVTFGLSHIRGVGGSSVEKIEKCLTDFKTWPGFLLSVKKIKRNVAEALIKSGACDCYGIPRIQMLRQLNAMRGSSGKTSDKVLKDVTPKELETIEKCLEEGLGLADCFQRIIDDKVCQKNRIETINKKREYILERHEDTNTRNAIWEKIYLGLALSCSIADDYEKSSNAVSCRVVLNDFDTDKFVVHAVIDEIKMRKTSSKAKVPDQDYCYLVISDNSGAIQNIVCWPKTYESVKNGLSEGCVATFVLKKDNWKGRTQYSVQSCEILG
jgi:DNA polymerase III alpha subunit